MTNSRTQGRPAAQVPVAGNIGQRVLRVPDVLERLGISRATLYLWLGEGKFVAPIQLGGNSVGFLEGEVDDWIASRPRRSYGPEAA